MTSKLVYDRPLPVSRAVYSIADKAQANTQQYGRRPYGVGLLVVGYDETGPHLYEFQPSGSVLEYYGTAIGARSQAARTYLERSYESFPDATLEQLVVHGLTALRDTLAQDKELTSKNTSVAVVGKDTEFKVIEDDQIIPGSKNSTLPADRNPNSNSSSSRTNRHRNSPLQAASLWILAMNKLI